VDTGLFAPLAFAGIQSLGNGDIINTGPTYTDPSFYPYIALDSSRNILLLHPGTFSTVRIGAVLGATIATAGNYDVSGAFARANDFQNAGSGVSVIVFVNSNIGNPLFSAAISSNNAVNPNSPFTGTGVAPFNINVTLSTGDILRFAVFSGANLTDGTFDVTALQATVTGAQYAATILADHPVAYWRLNEPPGSTVAVDSSGNGNNGQYEGSPTLGVPGLIQNGDTAVDFTNGDVVISDTPQLDFVSAPFAIEAWLKGTPLPSVGAERIFDKVIASTPMGYGFMVGLNYVAILGSVDFQSFPSLPSGVANYVTVVSSGTGTGLIYVNGVLVASGPQIAAEPYTGPAHIGVASDGTAHFTGIIGEVAVYNYALSAGQVLAHYEAANATVQQAVNVFPSQGTNSGPINVELTGSPLLSGAQVQLSATGMPAIPGTNTSSASPGTLAATFNLTGAAPGNRDVVITPVGGSNIVLSGAFTILQAPSSCSYTVAPLNPSFPAAGGAGSIVVTSNVNTAQCNFSSTCGELASPVGWITPGLTCHVVVGPPGALAQALAYQVAANPSASPRTATLSISGETVTVSQAGACSYSISPASEIFPGSGGSLSVTVLTSGGCAWSASSGLSWVHVTAGSSGSGTGATTIQADPNAGGLRSGSITIAGNPFSVSQSASACGASDVSSQVSVSRGSILAGFTGGYYAETVTLKNQGATSVAGPIYLVMDGLPTTRSQCGTFLGQAQTCSVTQASMLTHCQSPSGSDMVLFAPNGLAPGQQASESLTFLPGPAGGASPPNWYTTRVFSGTPNQ